MDQFSNQKIEQNAINQDVEKLGKEIQEKREQPEIKTQNYSEKDLIKQSIKPMVYPQPKAPTVVPAPQVEDRYLPDYLKNAPNEVKAQVEKLLENTFKNGLEKGVSEARKAPPFVLDAYHDALTDKLHEELVKRGFLR
ncbi:hypothetical protein HZB05_01640 [Candidatus Wolfebacteria bacterium]|nr:hypothetical protein [Candidatus Wolfebacteria bacterium]